MVGESVSNPSSLEAKKSIQLPQNPMETSPDDPPWKGDGNQVPTTQIRKI